VAAAIRTMTKESEKMKTLMDEVNQGSQDQACGIEQIGKALAQMEQVTQSIAAHAEETAASAEELNADAGTLRSVVNRLTEMAGNGKASRGAGTVAQSARLRGF
jgi:methyl-accepting chemotaxis protein/methyl-accepting chemotaxis protein-1 (serine sensor receptor)